MGITTDLSWTAGSGATSHNVYFGTSSPGTSRGNQTATTYDTGTMLNSTVYYWRIDEVNAYGTTTGTVWSFTTVAGSAPGAASNPSPSSGATGVAVTTDLSWTAGSGATSHNVYFGTSSPGTSRGNQTATTYDTGTMANSTVYYWRIDEVNAYGTTTGTVWSFTTAGVGTSLGVSADGHQITFDGEPIMLIGDSVTQGWMECGSNFNYQAYVDALVVARYQYADAVVVHRNLGLQTKPATARIGYNSPEYWPWTKNGSIFDLNSFNATYFTALANLVSYANSNGMVVLITIHDGWTKDRFCSSSV